MEWLLALPNQYRWLAKRLSDERREHAAYWIRALADHDKESLAEFTRAQLVEGAGELLTFMNALPEECGCKSATDFLLGYKPVSMKRQAAEADLLEKWDDQRAQFFAWRMIDPVKLDTRSMDRAELKAIGEDFLRRLAWINEVVRPRVPTE